MTEDRFEERLRQAAQDYHRPPATPREELWNRIAAARAARPAALERRSRRPTIDHPGPGPTHRVAAPADGEPRRPRPRAHARSTVMQPMYLMVAAVVGMQQPVVPRTVAPALARAQVARRGL